LQRCFLDPHTPTVEERTRAWHTGAGSRLQPPKIRQVCCNRDIRPFGRFGYSAASAKHSKLICRMPSLGVHVALARGADPPRDGGAAADHQAEATQGLHGLDPVRFSCAPRYDSSPPADLSCSWSWACTTCRTRSVRGQSARRRFRHSATRWCTLFAYRSPDLERIVQPTTFGGLVPWVPNLPWRQLPVSADDVAKGLRSCRGWRQRRRGGGGGGGGGLCPANAV
jgi:hypothetical protein